MKIGIFDSGLGGLLVFRHIQQRLPEYDYVYLGDTKRLPYGTKSQAAIFECTKEAISFLFEQECTLVILACNTASARALRRIQQEFLPALYPDKRVLGVIIPTVEAALAANPKTIGVIGTESTIESGTFTREIVKRNSAVRVVTRATPLLVPIIEHNDTAILPDALQEYIAPYRSKKLDNLLLGCTHYGIVKREIQDILGPDVRVISQEDIIPDSLAQYLDRHPEINKQLTRNTTRRICVTDITEHFTDTARSWFPGLGTLEYVTIES